VAEKITRRSEDYARWYTDVVQRADLADYYPVKGCMIIKPHGYAIWEKIQAGLDKMFKETGHVNAYFPMFIPESFMKKEAEHVEGFAPECAVVTHGGGKKLDEPLYIRPTSETVIGIAYSKWIQSYRDLPVLMNQWCNICRWEMRTRLFIRTTEFLWQEGHTAHATEQEAREEVMRMLGIYATFAQDVLALPVLRLRKTEREKFAGAVDTYSIEAMVQDKRAIQAGTSHYLGQNFAKAFDITFQDENRRQQYVYATSWGVSTRLIGAAVMAHSDDQGLVLPPKVAPIQVVIVPIWKSDDEKTKVLETACGVQAELKGDFAVKLDDRDQFSPGWKFNDWELRGVPLRIEIGPRDVAARSVVFVRRHDRQKTSVPLSEVKTAVGKELDSIQQAIFQRAEKFRDDNSTRIDTYDDFKEFMNDGGFAWCHWCGSAECEAKVQEETTATIRGIPLQPEEEKGSCICCGKPSPHRVVFAKAY